MTDTKTATEKLNNDVIKKQIEADIHIKYLSHAETVEIDGEEWTIIRYGFLSQAVGDAIDKFIETKNI